MGLLDKLNKNSSIRKKPSSLKKSQQEQQNDVPIAVQTASTFSSTRSFNISLGNTSAASETTNTTRQSIRLSSGNGINGFRSPNSYQNGFNSNSNGNMNGSPNNLSSPGSRENTTNNGNFNRRRSSVNADSASLNDVTTVTSRMSLDSPLITSGSTMDTHSLISQPSPSVSNLSTSYVGVIDNINPRMSQVDQSAYIKNTLKTQKFWKYHLMRVSKNEFYLTTNPDERHKFVRHAPSYRITLLLPSSNGTKSRKSSKASEGFRLVFERVDMLSAMNDNAYYGNSKKGFTIERKPLDIGGELVFNGWYTEYLDRNKFNLLKQSDESSQRMDRLEASYFGENVKNSKAYVMTTDLTMSVGYSYQSRIMGDCRIGMLHEATGGIFSKVHKSRVDGIKLGKEGAVYFCNRTSGLKQWHEQVVAMFRPCERGLVNKISKQITSSSRGSQSYQNSLNRSSLSPGDRYDTSASSPGSESEGKFYYAAKDGLFDRHPKDDSPNNFKLGWLTIFDKPESDIFLLDRNTGEVKGIWETILGLTLGASFENIIDKILSDE
ncbi:unnamed protein product [[Candida] boidinii]|uniref:Unnamed protein product n=1 Tax=Candida boidinii TaxID=5477 RepID=A0ACB5TJ87_CANBO|nr:unnamed protein product [[Candida] boidinii]